MISIDLWKPADGLILEPNALKAAREQHRCLALTAGPGAGKTEMLAQRADFLLRTGVCRYPLRILAISFKVDASHNLKERVRKRCGFELSGRFDSYTFHAFAKRIIDRFRVALTGNNSLDADYKIGSSKILRKQIEFNDLIPLAIQILQSCQVARNAIRKTYSDVFLDEFQDCTDKQYELIKLAFQGTAARLTAVGDTKQKIMGWAGALEGIFTTFASDFNATPLNMYRNFRSKPRLLRMQNEIIRVLDAASVMPADQIQGDEGDIYAWTFSNSQQEAEYIAELIMGWINNEGIPHAEIAILVSKQPDLYANLLMTELGKRNIPYRNEQQLQDISVEPIARLIIDYVLSLYSAHQPDAWMSLMQLLIPFTDEEEQNLRRDWQTFIKAERKSAFLMDILENGSPSWWTYVLNFLNKVGINNLTALSPDYESHGRMEEVLRDLQLKIQDSLIIEPDIIKALMKFKDDQAIRILTVHKSKGLEFHSVIMLGIERETFWGKIDEERCAYFVGISRAKRRLVLTYSQSRPKPPGASVRWDFQRTLQAEFYGYAFPFLSH